MELTIFEKEDPSDLRVFFGDVFSDFLCEFLKIKEKLERSFDGFGVLSKEFDVIINENL